MRVNFSLRINSKAKKAEVVSKTTIHMDVVHFGWILAFSTDSRYIRAELEFSNYENDF